MSKFKVGDEVICDLWDFEGKIVCLYELSIDTEQRYIITGINRSSLSPLTVYSVGESYLSSRCPVLMQTTKQDKNIFSPFYQDTFSKISFLPADITVPVVREVNNVKCDCGGFKTYESMDPSFHSTWCSVRK